MSDSRKQTAGVVLLGMLMALANSGSSLGRAEADEAASRPDDSPQPAATCPDQPPDEDGEDRKPDLGRPPYNVWDRIDRFDGQPRPVTSQGNFFPARDFHNAGQTFHSTGRGTHKVVVLLTPVDRIGPSHRPHAPPC